MARSLKKGPYIDERLLEKIKKAKPGQVIKTWARAASITPEMVGHTFAVHQGREFVAVKIREEMVGHRLGEFSFTTKFSRHGGKMQRELEQKQAESQAPEAQARKESTQKKTVEKKAK